MAIWSGNVCATGGNVGISLALDSWASSHALHFPVLFFNSRRRAYSRAKRVRKRLKRRRKITEAGEDDGPQRRPHRSGRLSVEPHVYVTFLGSEW